MWIMKMSWPSVPGSHIEIAGEAALIFNLRYYDELDYEEIARILDGKADTLKVNYHYAKEKIKEYILNN